MYMQINLRTVGKKIPNILISKFSGMETVLLKTDRKITVVEQRITRLHSIAGLPLISRASVSTSKKGSSLGSSFYYTQYK